MFIILMVLGGASGLTAFKWQRAQPPAQDAARGTYLVAISVEDSEAAARESFRVTQARYPGLLGSQKLVVSPKTMPDDSVRYWASVGPFITRRDAATLCESLKTASGQCFIWQLIAETDNR